MITLMVMVVVMEIEVRGWYGDGDKRDDEGGGDKGMG